MNNNNSFIYVISILLFLIAVNLFILDLKIFSPTYQQLLSKQIPIINQVSPTAKLSVREENENKLIKEPDNSCPLDCLKTISEATSTAKIGSNLSDYIVPTLPLAVKTTKEYYIPLGSGSTSKSSWDDMVATETVIDPSQYGTVKEVYLTVSLRNPTKNGQVEAQLYNATDKYAVYGGHLVMNNLTEQTLTSQKFALFPYAKLYRVQLKNTLSYQSYLDNAKLRLIAE